MVKNFRIVRLVGTALTLLSLASCFERCFPSKVSTGIARLTVNNLGKLILAISNDEFARKVRKECRLKELLPNATIEESENGYGQASWDFNECTYDFGTRTTLTFTDECGSTTTTYSGKVVATGRRTVVGILTQNPEAPVIPTKDGLSISFTNLRFENFRVESPEQTAAMTMVSGSLSCDLKIALGKAEDSICRIPIPNPTFSNIRYTSSGSPNIMRLPGFMSDFDAEVNGSDFGAQVGQRGDIENFMSGSLTLWGERLNVPNDGQMLDPTFERADFEKSLRCISGLALPLSTSCDSEDTIVSGVANLSSINLGAMLAMLATQEDVEPKCNLQSLKDAKITQTDKFSGKAEWSFEKCTLDFGREGKEFAVGEFKGTIFGKVTYSGVRSLRGRLTGNAALPVIPETGEVAVSFKNVKFENFGVRVAPHPSLTFVNAVLSFDVMVHLKKGGNFDAYSIPLYNPTLENIQFLESSDVKLSNPPGRSGDFKFTVFKGGNLNAQFNQFKDKENRFGGSLSMFGRTFSIAESKLIPSYKRVISDDTVSSAAKDSFEKVEAALGDGASRLSVLNLSRMIQRIVGDNLASIDNRPECRLRSLEHPEADADKQKVTWRFRKCEYNLPAPLYGRVILSGERSMEGYLTSNSFQPVIPTSGKYVFQFNDAEFHDYKVIEEDLGYQLTITKGAASFKVTIPLKVDPKTRLYSEPDNDLIYEHIRFAEGTQFLISVQKETSEFKGDYQVPVHNSDLNAHIAANKIDGTIGIFESSIKVPTDKLGLLDTKPIVENPQRPHQHNTIENFEALMIARFLILNLGTITQEAASEDLKGNTWFGCGFSSNLSRLQGVADGKVGERGRMQFPMDGCEIINESKPASLPDPCTEHPPLLKGSVIASGTQHVRGLRDEFCVLFKCFGSIIPDNPHAVDFDFSAISVDNFETLLPPRQETNIGGGLRMISGAFKAKTHPVLGEKKEKACDFGRTTPIAAFAIDVDHDVVVELELSHQGLPFFKSKRLTISHAKLEAQNGVFNGVGNFLTGEIVVNGGRFTFSPHMDKLDPFYDQQAFDKSYECRTKLEPDNKYFDGFAIREVLPPIGYTSDCPGVKAP